MESYVNRPVARDAATAARLSRQRRRDTAPELALRRELHRRGLRYRVNAPMPQMPRRTIDIAFTRLRLAVFVDGCFWHRCPIHGTAPASNEAWWAEKLGRNQERDAQTGAALQAEGWEVLRIWEHTKPVEAAEQVEAALRRLSAGD